MEYVLFAHPEFFFPLLSFTGVQGRSYKSNSASNDCISKEEEFTKNNSDFNTPVHVHVPQHHFQYHHPNPTGNFYCESPKRTPIPHSVPMPPYNPRSAATSPYRSMASKAPPPLDPNLKSNLRTEEHLTNREREVYGRNIVARTPSIDGSKNSLRIQNGHVHKLPVSYHAHGGFVQIHDSEVGVSQC